MSFEYTERSIDTTLRVIAITVADPRLGTPRQIELISDEGFFASQADAIAGVTTGVTGGVTSAEAEDSDILEWYWFPTIDVFTDDTGAFSGVVVRDLEDNLDNPSGADVVLAVPSRSSSLAGAFIVNGDLSISGSGVSANTTGNVTISATAMIGGTERVVERQIFFSIVYQTGAAAEQPSAAVQPSAVPQPPAPGSVSAAVQPDAPGEVSAAVQPDAPGEVSAAVQPGRARGSLGSRST